MNLVNAIKKVFMPSKIFEEHEQHLMARCFCQNAGKISFYNELDIKAFDAFLAGKGNYNPRPLTEADIPQSAALEHTQSSQQE